MLIKIASTKSLFETHQKSQCENSFHHFRARIFEVAADQTAYIQFIGALYVVKILRVT